MRARAYVDRHRARGRRGGSRVLPPAAAFARPPVVPLAFGQVHVAGRRALREDRRDQQVAAPQELVAEASRPADRRDSAATARASAAGRCRALPAPACRCTAAADSAARRTSSRPARSPGCSSPICEDVAAIAGRNRRVGVVVLARVPCRCHPSPTAGASTTSGRASGTIRRTPRTGTSARRARRSARCWRRSRRYPSPSTARCSASS